MIGLLDVGGTKLLAAVSGSDGRLTNHVERPTPVDGDPVDAMVRILEEAAGGDALDAISMSVPGPFDRSTPAFLNPPGNSRIWHGINLRTSLGAHFSCAVYAENDANCAALAEARLGAGRGHETVVYYTVSTGIGSGVVRSGNVVFGRHDTEGGHQVLWPRHLGGPPCDCGGSGCLETLASGRAIKRRFGCRAEDLDHSAAWDEIGYWLGLAVVNAVSLLDCGVVVFGGGVTRSWARFEQSLRQTVTEHLHLQQPPEVRLAELGIDRNLLGALMLADSPMDGAS